jgi:capsular exopolysaccharide synthesis family protein
MQLVDLRGFLRAVTRRWLSVLLLAALGLGAGLLLTAASTPWYQAGSQIFVSTRGTASLAELNEGSSFTQARVQSYAQIISSPRITVPVVAELKLDLTADQLASEISASVEFDTVLIDITVRDTEAKRAAQIANAVAAESSRQIVGLESSPGQPSPVEIGVTRIAAAPSAPVSPRPSLDAAAGLLLGLLLGVGLAVLREVLDTTVRDNQGLAEASGLPVLGVVPFDRGAPGAPIALSPGMRSPRAEAYRLVRTNLQFAHVDQHPRVILVTSAVAGEGKTNTAANLAFALAEAGRSTCLVDADLRSPSVAASLGLVQDAGLTTVLIGAARVEDVFQSAGERGLTVLTSGPIPPNPAEILASEQMRRVLTDLSARFDTVIVDSAPVLPVADSLGLAPQADGTILVVRAARTGGDRVRAAVDALRTVGAPILGSVLSMATLRAGAYGYGYEYGHGYEPPKPEPEPAPEPEPTAGPNPTREVGEISAPVYIPVRAGGAGSGSQAYE